MFTLKDLKMGYDRLLSCDIDGVILDIYPHLKNLVNKEWGVEIKNQNKYTIEVEGHTTEEVNELFGKHINKITYNCMLCEGAGEIIKFSNYEKLNFITVRPNHSITSTYDRIEGLLGRSVNISFVNGSKIEVVNKYNPRYFIEDRFLYANDIAENTNVEEVFLIDREWNRNRVPHTKVTRVKNIKEVIERIIFNNFKDNCPNRRESFPKDLYKNAYHCKSSGVSCVMSNCSSYYFVKGLYYNNF